MSIEQYKNDYEPEKKDSVGKATFYLVILSLILLNVFLVMNTYPYNDFPGEIKSNLVKNKNFSKFSEIKCIPFTSNCYVSELVLTDGKYEIVIESLGIEIYNKKYVGFDTVRIKDNNIYEILKNKPVNYQLKDYALDLFLQKN